MIWNSWADWADLVLRTATSAIVTYLVTKYAITHTERIGKKAKKKLLQGRR